MRDPKFLLLDGRYVWRPEVEVLIPKYSILESSPVSFPTEPAARDMHRLIEAARRVDGRYIVTRQTLEQLLELAADTVGGDCHFDGWVVPCVEGADGINWSVNWRETTSKSKSLMQNAVTKMRKSLNMDMYLDKHD